MLSANLRRGVPVYVIPPTTVHVISGLAKKRHDWRRRRRCRLRGSKTRRKRRRSAGPRTHSVRQWQTPSTPPVVPSGNCRRPTHRHRQRAAVSPSEAGIPGASFRNSDTGSRSPAPGRSAFHPSAGEDRGFGVVVVLSLAHHPTRLPLCGTELGIRKSCPPLTSRETKATPTNQLY